MHNNIILSSVSKGDVILGLPDERTRSTYASNTTILLNFDLQKMYSWTPDGTCECKSLPMRDMPMFVVPEYANMTRKGIEIDGYGGK